MNVKDMPKVSKDSSNKDGIIFHPIINGLQKMALYTTRSRCYLIGSNNTQTKFRVLKIDRTEPHKLVLTDDKVEYSQSEIKDLLMMIGGGNKNALRSTTAKGISGVTRTVSSFGIFGFIRFLEGYYIILITKRRKVAVIGQHSIYKVEDTSVIYIPHESVRKTHEDEHKYFKLFCNIDLTANFYFSYTYDLTNSLQYNMSPIGDMESSIRDDKESFMNASTNHGKKTHKSYPDNRRSEKFVHVGVRTFPSEKYVWNSFLLKPLKKNAHPTWILPITQGFVAQSNICVYGRSFFLTLIARRSAAYAGTRFLKRGANFEGDVANEVETEQIVYDAHISSLQYGRFTSFVQLRGSIPCHWSQDISKMVPKPPISIDVWDPYAETGGKHFNKLLRRFGSPIVVLNLVKKREKKRHESILNEEYRRLIQQLNITIAPMHRIQHVAVDMARINKDKKENVMSRLAEIAYRSIKKTGIFLRCAPYYIQHVNPDPNYRHLERVSTQGDKNFGTKRPYALNDRGRLQTGVVRVNCVDCLDRTNTAQFSLGKCALAFQLYCLGVLDKPSIEFDSDCVRILEEMYEDHGDTLALQYGGSQLVHRIATYRKTAPWTSQGNDIMQSLSRYLSNKFSDQEKQQAMNLFLGIFVPLKQPQPIWELPSDYILHHSMARSIWPCHRKSTSQWWDSEVLECLPLPYDQVYKMAEYAIPMKPSDSRIDLYQDFHRPFEFSVMSEFFTYHMNHSSSYVPINEVSQQLDESPFSVRRQPGSRPPELTPSGSRPPELTPSKKSLKSLGDSISKINPSLSGAPSTASNTSSGASSTETESTDDELSVSGFETEVESNGEENEPATPISFEKFLPTIPEYYGKLVNPLLDIDLASYKRYAQIGHHISTEAHSPDLSTSIISELLQFDPLTSSIAGSSYETRTPYVSKISMEFYRTYVASKERGPVPPKHQDLLKYQKFASGA